MPLVATLSRLIRRPRFTNIDRTILSPTPLLDGQTLPGPVHIRSTPTSDLAARGDKSGEWVKWYATAIPKAEKLYANYLTQLKADGLLNKE